MNENKQLVREYKTDKLTAKIYRDRQSMGNAAAKVVARKTIEIIAKKDRASIVYASAPSQEEFLGSLAKMDGIEWSKVVAFHLDEYVGLPSAVSQSLGKFIRDRLFSKVKIGSAHYINGNAKDIGKETQRYAKLLKENGLDIACVGIGENGHLAFNDPHVADFNDPLMVKVVELDDVSRKQQVSDGCFASLDQVPKRALTLTIPAIFNADHIFIIVPGSSKAEAVKNTFYGPISTSCPASILRKHSSAILFLEQHSAALL